MTHRNNYTEGIARRKRLANWIVPLIAPIALSIPHFFSPSPDPADASLPARIRVAMSMYALYLPFSYIAFFVIGTPIIRFLIHRRWTNYLIFGFGAVLAGYIVAAIIILTGGVHHYDPLKDIRDYGRMFAPWSLLSGLVTRFILFHGIAKNQNGIA